MTSATTVRPGGAQREGAQHARTDRRWLMLTVLLAGQFMAILDATIVNVAMPTIGTDLHASGAGLQLVVSGFIVSFAVLLITGARLGDLFGARRMFLLGVAGFTLSSLACGLAPNTGTLIGARFVQGATAAMMVPQIMSVIQSRFDGGDRAKALSAYSTVIAVGSAAGQVLGGVLVSADLFGAGWRPVFLVNVPIGLLVLVAVPKVLAAQPPRGARRVDLVGLALITPAVLLVVLPLVLGHEAGWPAWTFVAIAAGLVLGGVFVAVERRVAARGGDPLLDVSVLRSPGLSLGMATLSAGMVAFGGFLFTVALHLQQGLGDSPLRAGLTFAPAAVTFGLLGMTWRLLPARIHHLLTPVGFLLAAVAYGGMALDLRGGGHGGWVLIVLLLLAGTGMGAAYSPLLTNSLVRVPVARAADASGVLTTTIQLSQVIGVAVFGSVFLTLVTHPVGVAVGVTFAAIAALMVVGAGLGVPLARTVARARP